jgi:H+/Na+-translocating ferredoxin:NAD+ oxidoreductase subunit E
MSIIGDRLKNGIIKENPTFVQVIGMCPTLAVTSSAINGAGMGLASTVVLIGSNLVISLLRKVIPKEIRIPAYIVIIAGFVTLLQFLMQGYAPSLYDSLGIFIPLIVVNCIILGRAEAYASKNGVISSIFDAIGMGLGFTLSLTVLGTIRELLGAGSIFGKQIMPNAYEPALIMVLAPGAFMTLGILMAIINHRSSKKKKQA